MFDIKYLYVVGVVILVMSILYLYYLNFNLTQQFMNVKNMVNDLKYVVENQGYVLHNLNLNVQKLITTPTATTALNPNVEYIVNKQDNKKPSPQTAEEELYINIEDDHNINDVNDDINQEEFLTTEVKPSAENNEVEDFNLTDIDFDDEDDENTQQTKTEPQSQPQQEVNDEEVNEFNELDSDFDLDIDVDNLENDKTTNKALDLNKLKLNELKTMAREVGLSDKGSKQELITRLSKK